MAGAEIIGKEGAIVVVADVQDEAGELTVSEITKNGGIAICAPIAPYEADRRINRDLISSLGGFIEIYVNTSLEKCEERDVKGLYELARKGVIKEFTGISDPYEIPTDADENNTYLVNLIVSDGTNSTTLTMTVTITDVTEATALETPENVQTVETK